MLPKQAICQEKRLLLLARHIHLDPYMSKTYVPREQDIHERSTLLIVRASVVSALHLPQQHKQRSPFPGLWLVRIYNFLRYSTTKHGAEAGLFAQRQSCSTRRSLHRLHRRKRASCIVEPWRGANEKFQAACSSEQFKEGQGRSKGSSRKFKEVRGLVGLSELTVCHSMPPWPAQAAKITHSMTRRSAQGRLSGIKPACGQHMDMSSIEQACPACAPFTADGYYAALQAMAACRAKQQKHESGERHLGRSVVKTSRRLNSLVGALLQTCYSPVTRLLQPLADASPRRSFQSELAGSFWIPLMCTKTKWWSWLLWAALM